eukprot:sb/3474569/
MTAADTDKALQKAVNPAKTRKGKKILLAKEPQIIENDKQTMILKGAKTSGMVNDVLADMYKIRRQNTVMMAKSNPFLPFEDTQPLLDLLAKKDTSMFCLGLTTRRGLTTWYLAHIRWSDVGYVRVWGDWVQETVPV